ncbi:hypothetical protein HZH66_011129 [Vespula vulgaris]|uniref:Uncharacterized protein n=1 Tax=Vespula vulgaris TaxID=7454 RepID=A0A834JF24_VESVU|nr:hypothetical protein HZH66_011129 [Vespula vulgaris]
MESSGLVTEWSSLPNASRAKKERNRANDDVIASTPIVPTMTMNFRKESCINWMMCALCLASLAVSGILTYREMRLESRIGSLEARCRIQETPDVLVQRLRRELREEFEQHRLAPASAASAALFRIKRDVAECNCPPESNEDTNRLTRKFLSERKKYLISASRAIPLREDKGLGLVASSIFTNKELWKQREFRSEKITSFVVSRCKEESIVHIGDSSD